MNPDDDRLHQRPRLGHQAERPARDRGVQAQPGRARLPDPGELDQVDGRALARRDRRRSRSPRPRWPSSTTWCRRRPTCTRPTPSATWTTCRSIAREQRIDAVLTVGSGFGGFQSAMVLGPPERSRGMSTTVVVTGIGVAAPNGLGTDDYWAATLRGTQRHRPRSPASTRRGYPARLAGEVPGFDADEHLPEPAAAADRPHDPARPGRRRLGAGRRRRRPGRAARVRHGRGHRQLRRAASSSASASCRSCGARAASTSAPTSPSPGSTR